MFTNAFYRVQFCVLKFKMSFCPYFCVGNSFARGLLSTKIDSKPSLVAS